MSRARWEWLIAEGWQPPYYVEMAHAIEQLIEKARADRAHEATRSVVRDKL